MSMVFDEYGRPYVIIKDQESAARVKGVQAVKGNILAARTVCSLLRTSLGPKGACSLCFSRVRAVSMLRCV